MSTSGRWYTWKKSPDEPDGNEVVAHELVVVLPRLLKTKKEDKELLGPE